MRPYALEFLYLVAILDVASRKVLAFQISNTLAADFCVADQIGRHQCRKGVPRDVLAVLGRY